MNPAAIESTGTRGKDAATERRGAPHPPARNVGERGRRLGGERRLHRRTRCGGQRADARADGAWARRVRARACMWGRGSGPRRRRSRRAGGRNRALGRRRRDDRDRGGASDGARPCQHDRPSSGPRADRRAGRRFRRRPLPRGPDARPRPRARGARDPPRAASRRASVGRRLGPAREEPLARRRLRDRRRRFRRAGAAARPAASVLARRPRSARTRARAGGPRRVAVEEVPCPYRAASVDEWWERTAALAGPLARRLAALSDTTRVRSGPGQARRSAATRRRRDSGSPASRWSRARVGGRRRLRPRRWAGRRRALPGAPARGPGSRRREARPGRRAPSRRSIALPRRARRP